MISCGLLGCIPLSQRVLQTALPARTAPGPYSTPQALQDDTGRLGPCLVSSGAGCRVSQRGHNLSSSSRQPASGLSDDSSLPTAEQRYRDATSRSAHGARHAEHGERLTAHGDRRPMADGSVRTTQMKRTRTEAATAAYTCNWISYVSMMK